MTLTQVEKLLALPTADRVQLLEVLWESIQADTPADELTPKERKIVEERLRAYRARPTELLDWEEVKLRAFGG